MNPKVDSYLADGCGRCSHYRTPQCKVYSWREELMVLRELVLSCGLEEEFKWSQPCYTWQGRNVLIVTAFKAYACIAFFKGTLLADRFNMLVAPGKSSQAARQLRFTDVREIAANESRIRSYVKKAVEIEKNGGKVAFKKNPEPLPDELIEAFRKDRSFKRAFERLTPGRQRGYILYFNRAKLSKTRNARIEKHRSDIFEGLGINDNYKSRKK